MKKSLLQTFVASLTLLTFTFSAALAADVSEGYHLIKGTYNPSGFSGCEIILYVNNLENPTKGYLTKTGGSCTVSKQEVFPKKNALGFAFQTNMWGICKMSTFTFTGPDAEGKYGGLYESQVGTGQISVQQK